jgi:hypothetical protein
MVKRMLNYLGNSLVVAALVVGGAAIEHVYHPVENTIYYRSAKKEGAKREEDVSRLKDKLDKEDVFSRHSDKSRGPKVFDLPLEDLEVHQKNGEYYIIANSNGYSCEAGVYKKEKVKKSGEEKENNNEEIKGNNEMEMRAFFRMSPKDLEEKDELVDEGPLKEEILEKE